MQIEQFSHYSHVLARDMQVRVFGHGGTPIIMFPCQDGDCHNYDDFMNTISDYIDSGAVQAFVLDTVDRESWSDKYGDKGYRAWCQEKYYLYVIEEVLPCIYSRNHSGIQPITFGCSLGATHAAIAFLRRPDLFGGMLALSGIYDAKYMFDGWLNEVMYMNSPTDFMGNLPDDHYYIDIYNQKKIIFCVGQGAWEDEGIRSQRILQQEFSAKGIDAWFDFWGYDVNHDWPWWRKQIRYFLPYLV